LHSIGINEIGVIHKTFLLILIGFNNAQMMGVITDGNA